MSSIRPAGCPPVLRDDLDVVSSWARGGRRCFNLNRNWSFKNCRWDQNQNWWKTVPVICPLDYFSKFLILMRFRSFNVTQTREKMKAVVVLTCLSAFHCLSKYTLMIKHLNHQIYFTEPNHQVLVHLVIWCICWSEFVYFFISVVLVDQIIKHWYLYPWELVHLTISMALLNHQNCYICSWVLVYWTEPSSTGTFNHQNWYICSWVLVYWSINAGLLCLQQLKLQVMLKLTHEGQFQHEYKLCFFTQLKSKIKEGVNLT